MKHREWVIKTVPNELDVTSLADSLSISESLAKLLVLRGISTFAQAKQFFRPNLADLHDPFLMDGMQAATHRVIEAITNNQPVLIYGDYDVDGTCSTALMYMFLRNLGAQVTYYIPKRLEEGYGISTAGIDFAKSNGIELMISVDCGVTAVDETDYAKSLGIDLIICDHHKAKERIPDAFAVLDPLKPGCNYPFKYLSGAGVAFKLAQGVSQLIGQRDLPLRYLDLVALSGAADIVPLIDENRVLVREGLIQINEKARPGIKALMAISKIDPGTLTSGQIVFTLAPRINAVGRLGDAAKAVELLITEDERAALSLAQQLEDDNQARKKIDEETLFEAVHQIEGRPSFEEEKAIVIYNKDWHPGVIGIVASRLVEKYYKPCVMLTSMDGLAKGSARSISNFNIYGALRECEDMLVHFGGHEAAAGLAIEMDDVEEFRRRFNEIVAVRMDDDTASPPLFVDSQVRFADITPKFLRILEQFSPFGPGNMRPVFWASDVIVSGNARAVGSGGKHLMMTVTQRGCDKVFDAVGFDLGDYAKELNNGYGVFDMIFGLDQKSKDGKTFPQIRIREIRFKQG